jgi:hypothetical protein
MAKGPKTPKERNAIAAKMRGKALMLTGRQRKDLAMLKAREMAARGGYTGFTHVVEAMAREDDEAADTLRIWAGGNDISSIDMICEKWRRTQPRRG